MHERNRDMEKDEASFETPFAAAVNAIIDSLEDNLKSPECAAAINDIRQTEEAFTKR